MQCQVSLHSVLHYCRSSVLDHGKSRSSIQRLLTAGGTAAYFMVLQSHFDRAVIGYIVFCWNASASFLLSVAQSAPARFHVSQRCRACLPCIRRGCGGSVSIGTGIHMVTPFASVIKPGIREGFTTLCFAVMAGLTGFLTATAPAAQKVVTGSYGNHANGCSLKTRASGYHLQFGILQFYSLFMIHMVFSL